MTNNPSDTLIPTPIKYNVLMLTAAVISCEAISEVEAAQRALAEGPSVLDPRQLQWVVKYVSDKPIYLGESMDESAENTEPTADTPVEGTPKLEIVK